MRQYLSHNVPEVRILNEQQCITFGDVLLKRFGTYPMQTAILKFLEDKFGHNYDEIPEFPYGWEHQKEYSRVILKFHSEEEKECIKGTLQMLMARISLSFTEFVEEM
ncbi:MAG: hypothetical protein ABEI13_01225 [Candidatus Paceibacteria bacterium]